MAITDIVTTKNEFFRQLAHQFGLAIADSNFESFSYGPHAYILQTYLSLITANDDVTAPSFACYMQVPLRTMTAQSTFPDHAALATTLSNGRVIIRVNIVFLWEVKPLGEIWYGPRARTVSGFMFVRHLHQVNRQALSAFADPMGQDLTVLYAFLACGNHFHLLKYRMPPKDLLAKVKAHAEQLTKEQEDLENKEPQDKGPLDPSVIVDVDSDVPGDGNKRRKVAQSGRAKPKPTKPKPTRPRLEPSEFRSHFPDVVYYSEPMFDPETEDTFSIRFRNALQIATMSAPYIMGHDRLPDFLRGDLANDDDEDLQQRRLIGNTHMNNLRNGMLREAQYIQDIREDTDPIDLQLPLSREYTGWKPNPTQPNPPTLRPRKNSVAAELVVEDLAPQSASHADEDHSSLASEGVDDLYSNDEEDTFDGVGLDDGTATNPPTSPSTPGGDLFDDE
ncbi:hypothetical protein EUX98_g9021 [Antrodiella citrinella]|uniref:Uncharacterized protein n=1 Tax=Antrodiella citrinella TaxID=2447956 RepID=A0A4S4M158_9APHY|nr:hypothetical protein EUX98_g9021 [Antrodiella citrinella]